MTSQQISFSYSSQLQQGMTLIEALVALLLLSLSMLASVHLEASLRRNADTARQRTEALRLAQQDIERLRTLPPWAATTEATATATEPAPPTSTLTRYTLRRELTDDILESLQHAAVSVQWFDRAGTSRQVILHAHINRLSPVYSAVLSLDAGEAMPPESPAAPARK